MKKPFLLKISILVIACFAYATSAFAQSAQDVTKPLAYFPFGETEGQVVGDSSENAIVASIISTADSTAIDGSWVPGKFGGGFEFKQDKLVALPIGALPLYSDLGSVSVWAKAYAGNIRFMFGAAPEWGDANGNGPTSMMHLTIEQDGGPFVSGELFFSLFNEAAVNQGTDGRIVALYSDAEAYEISGSELPSAPVSPLALAPDSTTWYHIVMTWGNGEAKMYVDNELIVSDTYVPDFLWTMNVFNIGQGPGHNGNRGWNGVLDEFRIYDYTLSVDDIDMLYKNELPEEDPLSSKENVVSGLGVYPNPVVNGKLNLTLTAKQAQDSKISLTNLSGQTLLSQNISIHPKSNEFTMDVDGIERGVYFVRIVIDGDKLVRRVVIK